MWSEFYNYYFNNELKMWVGELIYYHGDYSHADLESDWRFKEVKGRRNQLTFIRLVDEPL